MVSRIIATRLLKRVIRGANFNRSKRLKWLHNRLVNLNVDLKLARNEALHEIVTALEIEIDVMKTDKNVLESQTEEQRDRKRAAKELAEEAQRVAKAAVKIAECDRKRAEKEAEEAQRVAKAAAKIAERDRKRAEKEAEEGSREGSCEGSRA